MEKLIYKNDVVLSRMIHYIESGDNYNGRSYMYMTIATIYY
jgi:hypothetical protein